MVFVGMYLASVLCLALLSLSSSLSLSLSTRLSVYLSICLSVYRARGKVRWYDSTYHMWYEKMRTYERAYFVRTHEPVSRIVFRNHRSSIIFIHFLWSPDIFLPI